MTLTAVVVAPGRGTYNRDELGYLMRNHPDKSALIADFDAFRTGTGQKTISELDGAGRFSGPVHTRGDNASPLIFACAYSDFLAINQSKIDVVAVTGNSMGWYVALTCAGVLSPLGGLEVVNTMGTLMHESLIGGQLVYPFLDDDWKPVPGRREEILNKISEIDVRPDHALSVSIDLGGMIVLAGNATGLERFEAEMPRVQDRFPMRLPNHSAFHSSLQAAVAEKGRAALSPELFRQPDLPLVDGRGAIWYPKSSHLDDLYEYTLHHQVVETYDYSLAIQTAAEEFMPDILIVLGPGTTLGGATAQSLVLGGWRGLNSKQAFKKETAVMRRLVAMGDPRDRVSVAQ